MRYAPSKFGVTLIHSEVAVEVTPIPGKFTSLGDINSPETPKYLPIYLSASWLSG